MKRRHSLDNYTKVTLLGRGAFAKVYLVRSLQDQHTYALKVIKKTLVMQKNKVQSIMTEKKVLSEINHPFLVSLKECFQDESKLYFILQYCPGGQLFKRLSLRGKLSEDQCKFIAAQIVLAIEALHQNGIIYCDLKPENVLIDRDGYIKLTDFGLAKSLDFQNQQMILICGTPQYLAPELILKQKYNKSIDWWCLGCILFEMVTGAAPFRSQNRKQLFNKILEGDLILPKVSPALQNLLTRLLQRNPKSRIGTANSLQIKNQFWFQNVKWDQLLKKTYSSPFAPTLASDIDVSHFDKEFTESPLESDEQTEDLLEEKMHFEGFELAHK